MALVQSVVATAAVLPVGIGYLRIARGSRVGVTARAAFVGGLLTWWLTVAVLSEAADDLFWVRALQFVLLAPVTGFLLATGRPVTAAASHRNLRRRLVRIGQSRTARVLLSPLPTSAAMLALPWLVFLTPWYEAAVRHAWVDAMTQLVIVVVATIYFYVRLQLDPVPHRRHTALSLLIATAETLGDGVLGVVLWQGGVIGTVAQQALSRDWGPSARTDQTIGAGILWVLGDVVGLPFLMLLFTRLRADDRRTDPAPDSDLDEPTERPWFLDDPELADRFRRPSPKRSTPAAGR